jgi:multiple sugar transport system ATP-binding protein
MAEVRLHGIGKSFERGAEPVISGLDLDIPDGELMVLVGPSGCGKSTTLRIIAGLEDATSGEVFIGNRNVNGVAPKDRDIAMVFQNYALYPHMNVRENLAFGLKMRRTPKEEINARVQETSELLGIGMLLDRKPAALSGGERQRVALGRAIIRKPAVFLFDEPLSNLDAKLRVQMRSEIKKLHLTLGTTMIYVTHDQVEAMTMGDRIAVMNRGVIRQVAPPLTIYHSPTDLFTAGFIGTPPMNFLRMTVRGSERLVSEDGSFELNIQGGHGERLRVREDGLVVMGIRPDRVALDASRCKLPEPVMLRHRMSELLGDEMYLYFSAGAAQITARANSSLRLRFEEEIQGFFDMADAHFFDPETERRIDID